MNRQGKAITKESNLVENGWGFGSDDGALASIAYNPASDEYLLAYSGPDPSGPDDLYIFKLSITIEVMEI